MTHCSLHVSDLNAHNICVSVDLFKRRTLMTGFLWNQADWLLTDLRKRRGGIYFCFDRRTFGSKKHLTFRSIAKWILVRRFYLNIDFGCLIKRIHCNPLLLTLDVIQLPVISFTNTLIFSWRVLQNKTTIITKELIKVLNLCVKKTNSLKNILLN